MSMKEGNEKAIEQGFLKALNVHGYPFQYAVLNRLKQLSQEQESRWRYVISEFPVESKAKSTHIDFILRDKHHPVYLVCECKRPDPKKSRWCFATTPDRLPGTAWKYRCFNREVLLKRNDDQGLFRNGVELNSYELGSYNLAFELKTNKRGEGCFGSGMIGEATNQVLRGLNGFISYVFGRFLDGDTQLFDTDRSLGMNTAGMYAAFIPIIFTTAELYTCDVDISEAKLSDGKLKAKDFNLKPCDWVLYNYAQSPDLKHQLKAYDNDHDLRDVLLFDYLRSIPIVSATGIEAFMTAEDWSDTHNWNRDGKLSGLIYPEKLKS